METLILLACAVGGILIHLIAKYRDAITQKKVIDWKLHLVNTAFSVIVCSAIVFFRSDINGFIDFEFTRLIAFFMGYFSDSIWKNITTFYGNKLKAQEE